LSIEEQAAASILPVQNMNEDSTTENIDFNKVQQNKQIGHIDKEEHSSKICEIVPPILNDQLDEVNGFASSECQSDRESDVDMEFSNNTNLVEDKEPIHHSDNPINLDKGI